MKHFLVLLKLGATVALFWFVFSKVDLAELAARMTPGQIATALAAGVSALTLQAYLVAHRLRLCTRMLGHHIPLFSSWVASQYAGFFSHTPISFVGGDAMRVWHMVKSGIPLPDAAKAVVLDRALGFLGMMMLVVASAPALSAVIKDPSMWTGFLLLAGSGTAAGVVFLLLGGLRPLPGRSRLLRWLSEFATLSRYMRVHAGDSVKAVLLGLAVTAINVIAIWAIGLGYNSGLGLAVAFSAAPIVFLISMIPISVAGWGLREGAFVVALGLFDISPATALSLSITFGIAVLLAYAPAPVLWFLARRRSAATATREGYVPASEARRGRS